MTSQRFALRAVTVGRVSATAGAAALLLGAAWVAACSSASSSGGSVGNDDAATSSGSGGGGSSGSSGSSGGSNSSSGGSSGGSSSSSGSSSGGGSGSSSGSSSGGSSGSSSGSSSGGGSCPAQDLTCDTMPTDDGCYNCCASNHPSGSMIWENAFYDCVCGPPNGTQGVCQSQCANSDCSSAADAGTLDGGDPCSICEDNAVTPDGGACNGEVGTACGQNADCLCFSTCINNCEF